MNHVQVKVACTQDVLNVMEIGQRNRSVAETKMNERSSRSHSVLTIIVDGLNNVTGIRTHGCLHLIDLAGKLDNLAAQAGGLTTRDYRSCRLRYVAEHVLPGAVCTVCPPGPSLHSTPVNT